MSPDGQRHLPLAVGKLRARDEVVKAGAIADAARADLVGHEQRVDEHRAIRALEPDGDLRAEVEAIDGLAVLGGIGRVGLVEHRPTHARVGGRLEAVGLKGVAQGLADLLLRARGFHRPEGRSREHRPETKLAERKNRGVSKRVISTYSGHFGNLGRRVLDGATAESRLPWILTAASASSAAGARSCRARARAVSLRAITAAAAGPDR